MNYVAVFGDRMFDICKNLEVNRPSDILFVNYSHSPFKLCEDHPTTIGITFNFFHSDMEAKIRELQTNTEYLYVHG